MIKQDKALVAKWLENRKVCTSTPKGFYVYVAVSSGIVYYVGKGKGTRYKHVNSGQSGNKELNRLHFLGVKFEVYCLMDDLTEQESFILEASNIKRLKPLFNSTNPNVNNIGKSGIVIKGWGNQCRWCNKKFSKSNLPGPQNVCDAQETGLCIDCFHYEPTDEV